jgi:hypothetical protein
MAAAVQRNKYQKAVFKQLSQFWSGLANERAVPRPWKHAREKDGVVRVYWLNRDLCAPIDRANEAVSARGIMLDWCDEHRLSYKLIPFARIPGANFVVQVLRSWPPSKILCVEIPPEPKP